MPDPTSSDPRAAAVDALIAAGATDEEITSILKEKYGKPQFVPGGPDSIVGNRLRGVYSISDAPAEKPKESEAGWAGLPFIKGLIANLSPTTIRDNLIKSPVMQGAAHPETAGDIANLLIPSGIEGAVSGAQTLGRSLKGAIKPGAKLSEMPRQLVTRIRDRWTDPLSLGERATRDAPLYKQMDILEGPPVMAEAVRTGTPPYQPSPPPFHERPLYQQMSDLPETPAPILGQPTPPVQQGPVPFHERPLYQQMEQGAFPETEAPILGRGADAPYQPTPTPAKPSGPAPTLRKATQTPDEILIEKLQEGLTPEGPTTVSAATEPTATATGRPSVQPSQYDAIVESAEGRGTPRVEDITPDAPPDLGTTSGFEPTTMSEEAVAARKARAGGGEPAPATAAPAGETPGILDTLVEDAQRARQQATQDAILDYHGTHGLRGVSRKQIKQVDTRPFPHPLSGEAKARIAGKVSEGLTSPEARQGLIEYYNNARNDLFKNQLGTAMRKAGILPSE